MTQAPPVLFAEDDEALRIATTQALELAGHRVQAFDRAAALLASLTGAFDGAIISDIRMPGLDGLGLLAAVRNIDSGIPVLLVTGHGDIPMAVDAMRKGAFDFIEKPFDDEQLLSQVRAALESCEEGEPQKGEATAVLDEVLSSRQREVLQRVLDGKPSRQIAEELAISVKTVEFHRARIMQKLGVKTAAELFRRCLGAG